MFNIGRISSDHKKDIIEKTMSQEKPVFISFSIWISYGLVLSEGKLCEKEKCLNAEYFWKSFTSGIGQEKVLTTKNISYYFSTISWFSSLNKLMLRKQCEKKNSFHALTMASFTSLFHLVILRNCLRQK